MLMRSFTKREKVMLLVLVLVMFVGLYILVVHNPVKANLARLEEEKEDADLRLQVAQIQAQKYREMESELEEIFAMPQDQITVMPLYDNAERLMVQLNHIFGELEYDLNFSEVVFQEKVAARGVQFTFTAPDYATARSIIQQLSHTGNRSLMNTLNIAPAEETGDGGFSNINLRSSRRDTQERTENILEGPLTVSGTITFYESAPNAAEAQSED